MTDAEFIEKLGSFIKDSNRYYTIWGRIRLLGLFSCALNMSCTLSLVLDSWSTDRPWLLAIAAVCASVGYLMSRSYRDANRRRNMMARHSIVLGQLKSSLERDTTHAQRELAYDQVMASFAEMKVNL